MQASQITEGGSFNVRCKTHRSVEVSMHFGHVAFQNSQTALLTGVMVRDLRQVTLGAAENSTGQDEEKVSGRAPYNHEGALSGARTALLCDGLVETRIWAARKRHIKNARH